MTLRVKNPVLEQDYNTQDQSTPVRLIYYIFELLYQHHHVNNHYLKMEQKWVGVDFLNGCP